MCIDSAIYDTLRICILATVLCLGLTYKDFAQSSLMVVGSLITSLPRIAATAQLQEGKKETNVDVKR